MASVGTRRSPSPTETALGGLSSPGGGCTGGGGGKKRQSFPALMQLRVVVEDDYLAFVMAFQVLPLRVELSQNGGILKAGSFAARTSFRSGPALRDHVLLLEGSVHATATAADGGSEGGLAEARAGEGFATAAAAALGAGKRRKPRSSGNKRAGPLLVGAAARRARALAAASASAAAAAAGVAAIGMSTDARLLMPTMAGGASGVKVKVEEEEDCHSEVMSELMAAAAGDLFEGGHAEDVMSLLEEDDFENRDSTATDYDTLASQRDSFYGSDAGRDSFRESFRESSVSAVSVATGAGPGVGGGAGGPPNSSSSSRCSRAGGIARRRCTRGSSRRSSCRCTRSKCAAGCSTSRCSSRR